MSKQKFKYILMLSDGDTYFGNTLWQVVKEIVKHRVWHWKRGDGWMD